MGRSSPLRRGVVLAGLAALTMSLVACPPNSLLSNLEQKVDEAHSGGGTVATPVFSASTGTYSSDQSITITDATHGASIHYTTDGSTPTVSTTLYTGAISVAGNGTTLKIKAIGAKVGMTDSTLVTASYTINYNQVSTPQVIPAGGTFNSDQIVTISCGTTGATIYYTTNGIDPTTSSTQYTGPISVHGDGTTQTIKAIASKSQAFMSTVASATYTIYYPINLTVSAGPGGTTSPSGALSVNHGAATSIAATPTTGNAFGEWSVTSGTGVTFGDANSASTTVTLTGGPATIQANFGYLFTWTDQILAGSRRWYSIASSSDGTKLAAAVNQNGGGDIWTSIDGGVHWTDRTAAGARNWHSIASSSDGTNLAAAASGGDIWTSTDSGVHWTDQILSGTRAWQSVASSSNGLNLAAAEVAGDIWTSTDSGVHWTDQALAGSREWQSVASSSDGSKLAAVELGLGFGGSIWTSTDSGAHWTNGTPPGGLQWQSIASSADGSKLVACPAVGDIWTSTDGGGHWSDQTLSGSRFWYPIASSSDGTKLAAAEFGGIIWTSADSGVHWTNQSQAGGGNWSSIASSADGSKLIAGLNTGDILTGQ